MKENKINKIKSIVAVMVMVLSVMTAVYVTMPAKADQTKDNKTPGDIKLTAPANGSCYFNASTITISWANLTDGGTTFYDIQGFWINVSGPAFTGWKTIKNITTNSTSSYTWDISDNVSRGEWGEYWIKVCAYNFTGPSSNFTECGWSNYTYILGTPGYNMWEGGNFTTTNGYRDNNVITTSTSSLVYHPTNTVDIKVSRDSSLGWAQNDETYYLFKPLYNGTDDFANGEYDLRWTRADVGESIKNPNKGSGDHTFQDITLDRAGLWIIDNLTGTSGTDADLSSYANFNRTVPAWFWVNSSDDFTLSVTSTSFEYNSSGTITLSAKDSDGDATSAVFDVRRDSNASSVTGSNEEASSSGQQYYKNHTYFWCAGNYTAYSYKDVDGWDRTSASDDYVTGYNEQNMGNSDAEHNYYNLTYGANANLNDADSWLSSASRYNWALCGPFDPPEYEASTQDIQVTTGTPYTSVTNETQYWGFDGEVNITFKETASQVGTFTESTVVIKIYDDDDVDVTSYFWGEETNQGNSAKSRGGYIDDHNISKGYFTINMTEWGRNASGTKQKIGDNGTWSAVVYVDTNGDWGENNKTWTEEWNATIEWRVKKAPKAQWKWIDDDGVVNGVDRWGHSANIDTDGVIPYIPDVTNVPLNISFQILSQGGNYFGAIPGSGKCTTLTQAKENITLTGNALFTGTFDKIPGVAYSAGTWTVPVIPTMSQGGGTITIEAVAFNSSASGEITIGGNNVRANGTIASVTPNQFDIGDKNQTLTATAKFADDGSSNTLCSLELYYINDNGAPYRAHRVNRTAISDYTMPFYKTQQKGNQTSVDFDADGTLTDEEIKAPRNLTMFIDGPGKRDGYALIKMDAISDLELELSRTEFMAGHAYDDFTITCTVAGNSTATPKTDAADVNNFYIKIYDENDNDVTDTLLKGGNLGSTELSGQTGDSDRDYVYGDQGSTWNNVYATKEGTYRFFAYNNTHNTEGYNGTLTVTAVNVVCDKSPLIWKADQNLSVTFTITYKGQAVNGSLRLDNVTDDPVDYNKTWANTSFSVSTQSDENAGNNSMVLSDSDITNGVVTVKLTASYLPAGDTNKTITFFFEPEESSSVYAKAGTMKVEVPSVTPDPGYIPLGETSRVLCTVTGRGENLNNVFVRAHGLGVNTNGTSNAAGQVEFSLTPSSTGNISIDVGETGRTLPSTEAVIQVTTWKLNIAVSPDTVDEGGTFTVTVTEQNSGKAVNGATVTINGIGTGTTDSNGEATFTAPSVTSDRSYTIKASKNGYAPETDTVTIFVTNIPNLYINAPETVTSGETFTVVAGGDDGNSFGITVTFNGETKTTAGPSGITFKAPSVKKDTEYTITATKTGYTDATPFTVTVEKKDTPGFELLALIAAIGVAFILLRRRRNK